MIPRGADFPPDSAPPAKRRESATMRHERPALPAAPPRAVRLPRGKNAASAGQGPALQAPRVMTPGVFGPATPRTATASISLLFSASSGPRPRAPIAWLRGPRPRKNGNVSSSPNRCGGLAYPAIALGSSRGLFSISPRKKRTGSVSSRFSLRILSLAAAFSLLNISSGRFPRGFGGAESVFRRFRS